MRQFNRDRDIINSLQSYQPQPIQGIDWAVALNAYTGARDKALDDSRREALATALGSGDQEQIDKAALAVDPAAFYANRLAQAQRQQQREWAVADREQQHQWDLEKLEKMNQNALGLAKAKAMLDSGQQVGNQDLASLLGVPLTGNKKYDEALLQQAGKDKAAALKGEQATAAMRPSVSAALDRAEIAADSGNGIGKIGATLEWLGLNPAGGSGENYTDIETANSQMNALLRQKLQATGLTGSELNSAAEANAYRYTISPFDSEARIKQKIANFRKDYLGEAQPMGQVDDYKSKYGLR